MEKYLLARQVLPSDDAMKSSVLKVKLAGFWEALRLTTCPKNSKNILLGFFSFFGACV
jgi:hypothetical protein